MSRGPKVKWGRMQYSWICRCDCERIVQVPQARLPYRASIPAAHVVMACDDCRARACRVCGAPIPASSAAKTCSPACKAEDIRRIQREFYHRKRKNDPAEIEKRRERHRRTQQEMSADEKRDLYRQAYQRRRATEDPAEASRKARADHARRMQDPDYAKRRAERQAAWREANRAKLRIYHRDVKRRKRAEQAARELGATHQAMTERMNDDDQQN